MKLKKLISIVNKVYPDGAIANAAKGNDTEDGLALFIVSELKDTYNENASDVDQLTEALRAIGVASDELQKVFTELAQRTEDAERKANGHKPLYHK